MQIIWVPQKEIAILRNWNGRKEIGFTAYEGKVERSRKESLRHGSSSISLSKISEGPKPSQILSNSQLTPDFNSNSSHTSVAPAPSLPLKFINDPWCLKIKHLLLYIYKERHLSIKAQGVYLVVSIPIFLVLEHWLNSKICLLRWNSKMTMVEYHFKMQISIYFIRGKSYLKFQFIESSLFK